MNKYLAVGILVFTLTMSNGCIASLPEGQSGAVAMIPFANQESGIRGNMPLEGWSDQAAVVQQTVSGTLEELTAEIVAQTDLVRLPDSVGTYRGAHLDFALYTFGTQLPDTGPGIFQVDMGLAKAQQENRHYVVFLVARAEGYPANQALYQTVFEHAMYALEPLD